MCEIKIICQKCNNPVTTVLVETEKIKVYKVFCYPCDNDSWQNGADTVSKQMMRSLK